MKAFNPELVPRSCWLSDKLELVHVLSVVESLLNGLTSRRRMHQTRQFVSGGTGNTCLRRLRSWSSSHILPVATLQTQVVRTFMSPVEKETGSRASQNQRGLRAIDLVQRMRESKEKTKSQKKPKTKNLKEVREQNRLTHDAHL